MYIIFLIYCITGEFNLYPIYYFTLNYCLRYVTSLLEFYSIRQTTSSVNARIDTITGGEVNEMGHCNSEIGRILITNLQVRHDEAEC
jgi:hypothetical protein